MESTDEKKANDLPAEQYSKTLINSIKNTLLKGFFLLFCERISFVPLSLVIMTTRVLLYPTGSCGEVILLSLSLSLSLSPVIHGERKEEELPNEVVPCNQTGRGRKHPLGNVQQQEERQSYFFILPTTRPEENEALFPL